MKKEELKGIKVISANVNKLRILEELAITSRINAQSVLVNNETISKIVSELGRTDTHVTVTNSVFNSTGDAPVLNIMTDVFPDNEEVLWECKTEDLYKQFFEDEDDEDDLDEPSLDEEQDDEDLTSEEEEDIEEVLE